MRSSVRGATSIAGFHKDLRSYVYRQTQQIDFSRYGVALPDGLNPIGFYTQPANGSGGRLSGAEFTVSVPFGDFVPVYRGRRLVDHPPLDPAQVTTFGLIIARQEGEFLLDLERIDAYGCGALQEHPR